MKETLKILILEDSSADAEMVQRLLVKNKLNCEFRVVADKKRFLMALDQFHPDIILSDHSLPQFDSRDALVAVRQRLPGIPFIMVTGTVSEEYAADVIKLGADDYILKDRMTRLPAAIEAAIKQRRIQKEIEDYKYALDQSAIVAITDQKGIIQYANGNFCKISKYSARELIGQDHRIINSGYHPKSYIKDLWVTIANGKIWRGELCNKAKDGSFYWVDTTIIPFLNEKAKPYQYLAIRIDITEKKKAEEKIKQSETSIRTIFENTSEGFLLMDRNAVIITFNSKASAYSFFSKSEEFKVGQSIFNFIENSRKEFFQEIISNVLKGEDIQYDRSYKLDNGDIAWIDFSMTPVIETGQVNGICITERDITEKKKIEQEREFDRSNLKALINNTNDLMWSVDMDLKLITSNEAFDKVVKLMSGKSVAKGNNVLAIGFSDEQLNRFNKYYERAFSGESFMEIEYSDFPDDLWSEISFYPIYNGAIVIGAACFSHDITGRKKAEKEITDYKNALDQSSIVSITDKKGTIKYVNDNFCKISGYSVTELIGRDHRLVKSGYHSNIFMNDLWKMIAKGKIWRGEFCNKAKDGTLYWIDTTIVPFLNNKGKVVQYIEITTDITEKKMLEQEILEQKVQEQRKIARAIISAQEKERNHLSMELHDNVNQILAGTKLYLGMAGRDEKMKELIKYPMELIDSAIQEIRLISHKNVTPQVNINLKELIQRLLDDLDKNTTIKTTFVYNLTDELISDDLKLNVYRIIQEQLNNVMKHADAKNVSVSVQAEKNIINIIVTDDGKGFDINKKGNGIGISNMINRIESFNGEMIVDSAPGEGCRIIFKAPF